MAEARPFPPSPRRLALARKAGLTAASPVLVAAIAWTASVAAVSVLGRAAVAQLAAWLEAACRADPGLAIGDVPARVVALVLPLVGIAAVAAAIAHVVQVGGVWRPRREVAGAPAVPVPRTLALLAPAVIGGVAFAWLWLTAPRLALLVEDPGAGVLAIGAFGATLAIGGIALGAVDALWRRVLHVRALAMTAAEKREDDRQAAADPRWRARRLAIARGPSGSDAVAGAALLLLGDDVAVAIAWHPTRQPVPLRTATGRRARATQLLGLARRYRVPVHRDPALAAELARAEGPVPTAHWARLAEIVAAVRARV